MVKAHKADDGTPIDAYLAQLDQLEPPFMSVNINNVLNQYNVIITGFVCILGQRN